jgi:hypothetical protein
MNKTFLTFIALIIAGLISVSATVSAEAQDNPHSVWTFDGGGREVTDPDLPCHFTKFEKFRMITSWTEPTPGYAAQAHFRGAAVTISADRGCDNRFYEFVLLQATTTTFNNIVGYWDVYRDGVLMCSSCTGSANGLIQPVTNYYKVTVDDPVYGSGAWFYSGFIDQRYDF